MDDLISRRAAIDALEGYIDDNGIFNQDRWFVHGIRTAITHLRGMPSAQPDVPDTNVGDMISRRMAMDALSHMMDTDGFRDGWAVSRANVDCMLRALPSAQLEIEESLYQYKCFITDTEGLQHEVVHVGDIRRVTGWEI